MRDSTSWSPCYGFGSGGPYSTSRASAPQFPGVGYRAGGLEVLTRRVPVQGNDVWLLAGTQATARTVLLVGTWSSSHWWAMAGQWGRRQSSAGGGITLGLPLTTPSALAHARRAAPNRHHTCQPILAGGLHHVRRGGNRYILRPGLHKGAMGKSYMPRLSPCRREGNDPLTSPLGMKEGHVLRRGNIRSTN